MATIKKKNNKGWQGCRKKESLHREGNINFNHSEN
jgi:hypothetical protein